MDQKNLINKLRLIRTPNIGPITCQLLMRRYGSAAAALDAIPDLSARGGRPLKLATRQQIEREIEQADRLGASFIGHGDEDYPACLLQFDDAPFVLTVKGHKSLLNKKGCALVGARNASINATRLAQSLAMEIVRRCTALYPALPEALTPLLITAAWIQAHLRSWPAV